MENLRRGIPRGRRKENIPPFLRHYVTSEQRNIQRNVNLNQHLDTGIYSSVSHYEAGAAFPVLHHSGVPQRRSHVISNGSAKAQQCSLVQSNLSCPYRPFSDSNSGFSNFCNRQQSNLESKLQRNESESAVFIDDPCPLHIADLGPSCSRLDSIRLRSPPNDFLVRGKKLQEGLGFCDASHTCCISKRRMGNKDQHKTKQPLGHSFGLGSCGNLETCGDLSALCSTGCFLPDSSPQSPSRSFDSLPPGPGLTLDHLRSSISVESPSSSMALQALLQSSKTSAIVPTSIQLVKQKSISVEPLSSTCDQFPTMTVLSAVEKLAREESCAMQASVKRQTSLMLEGGYSNASFCYIGSGAQTVLEEKGASHHRKTHHHPKLLGLEELPSRLFHCSELDHRDLALDLPSIDDLKMLCARAPENMGMPAYGSKSKVSLTVHSPGGSMFVPTSPLGNGSEVLEVGEPREAHEALLTPDLIPESAAFLQSPVGSIARKDTGEYLQDTDGAGRALFGEAATSSQNPICEDCSESDKSKRLAVEEEEGDAQLLCCEDGHGIVAAIPKEHLERDDGPMDWKRDNSLTQKSNLLVETCFWAWHDNVCYKRATARALYERQLLRKGLSALQWAVQLRDIQAGIVRRRHKLALLSVSFHRWQEAAAQQHKEHASRQHLATCNKALPASPRTERVTKCLALSRMPAQKHLREVSQYCRAEGSLWIQLRYRQETDVLDRRANAVWDLRRLAAAFRLWCLQKEHQGEEETRAQESYVLLEKKRLGTFFRMWRSHCRASGHILPPVAHVQRGLICRCFGAWKSFTKREAQSKLCLGRQRIKSLRLCFQQWDLMVKLRERTRKTLLELLQLRWRKFSVKLGLNSNAPTIQVCSDIVRWSRVNSADALDCLYCALPLQNAFWIWMARWRECRHANAFRHALEQRQLRENLQQWWWKALRRSQLAENFLLARTGFHSNPPAPPDPSDSSEKAQVPRQLLAPCFAVWSAPTWQNLKAEQHQRHTILFRAFVSWSVAAACGSAQCKAWGQFERIRQQRFLALCFGRWKTADWGAQHQQKEEERPPCRPAGFRVMRRWRKATRAYQGLCLNSVAGVKQASSYSTRAATFRHCFQHRISLIRAPKLVKTPPSWLMEGSRGKGKGLLPTPVRTLNPSPCRISLTSYRCQSRTLQASWHCPLKSPGAAGQTADGGAWLQETNTNTSPTAEYRRQLGRKYLRVWQHGVLLCHFQDARKTRHLVRAWMLWKDACRIELIVQGLAKRRLAEWTWQTWRRRCLQSWVVECFQEAEARSLLQKAFDRWRQQANV